MTDESREEVVVIALREGADHIEFLVLECNGQHSLVQDELATGEGMREAVLRLTRSSIGSEPLMISMEPIFIENISGSTKKENPQGQVYFFAAFFPPLWEIKLSAAFTSSQWIHCRQVMRLFPGNSAAKACQNALAWVETDKGAARFLARNLNRMR